MCFARVGILCFALSAFPGSPLLSQSKGDALRLRAISSIPLSSQIEVGGADIADNGTVLYWFRRRSILIRSHSSVSDTLCNHSLRRVFGAAFVAGDSAIQVVEADLDGDDPRIIRVSLGKCEVLQTLGAVGKVQSAVHAAYGWVLALQEDTLTDRFMALDQHFQTRWFLNADSGRDGPLNLRRSTITADGQRLLISSIHWPFATTLVDSNGVIQGRFVMRESGARGIDSSWIALRSISLGQQFVQVIADPLSDRRAIVRLGGSDSQQVTSVVDASIGFVAVARHHRLVLALRRLNTEELVVYAVLGTAAHNY